MNKKVRIKVRSQEPVSRVGNFDEVPYGYNEGEAVEEASRCIQCKNAGCISGCPVNVNIKDFVGKIAARDFRSAIGIIKENNSLPAVCGRVCPQESQCEEKCVLLKTGNPVNIGALERFAAEWEAENIPLECAKVSGGKIKVAIAGSGPAGLTVAGELVKMGYKSVIFEGLHIPGGVLVYGIPEFRLPKHVVKREIRYLQNLGVEINTNVLVGKSYTIQDLFGQGFRAVFIGVGAGTPAFMKIQGENLKGVYSANEFLTRVNLLRSYKFPEFDTPVRAGKKVAVIGAGNVAMDAARVSKRLYGVDEVHIIYRRSEKEMPARHEEIEHAKEEGIIFDLLTAPIQLIGDSSGTVNQVKCIRMQLGAADESGRRGPEPVAGSEFLIEADTVISALGTKANEILTSNVPGLKLNKRGYIETDAVTCATSLPGVFAGGDITTGSATVIAAMGAGKRAARYIDEYIRT
jgi:glutamate synthase (NADPH/NADH) small chain